MLSASAPNIWEARPYSIILRHTAHPPPWWRWTEAQVAYPGRCNGITYNKGCDLMICHPPCNYTDVVSNRYLYYLDDNNLPTSGQRTFQSISSVSQEKREASMNFAKKLYNVDILCIALGHPRFVFIAYPGQPQFWCHSVGSVAPGRRRQTGE